MKFHEIIASFLLLHFFFFLARINITKLKLKIISIHFFFLFLLNFHSCEIRHAGHQKFQFYYFNAVCGLGWITTTPANMEFSSSIITSGNRRNNFRKRKYMWKILSIILLRVIILTKDTRTVILFFNLLFSRSILQPSSGAQLLRNQKCHFSFELPATSR